MEKGVREHHKDKSSEKGRDKGRLSSVTQISLVKVQLRNYLRLRVRTLTSSTLRKGLCADETPRHTSNKPFLY